MGQQMTIDTLRNTVDIPRVPVRALNLHGDRDLTHLHRYIRRTIPTMTATDLELTLKRIYHMTPEEDRSLNADEYRGIYMLIRILRDELRARTTVQ